MHAGAAGAVRRQLESGRWLYCGMRAKPQYSLGGLIAQCDLNAPPSAYLVAKHTAPPVLHKAF